MDLRPASAVVPPIGPWQLATVTAVRTETPTVRTFTLALPEPMPHLAGQHVVVKLTAPDGYTAQRSYSIATPPAPGSELELTIERLADGEVSTFLHDELVIGDTIEVRGPIGGWFVWDGVEPALLVGGGSGVVPLMAMLRQARRDDRPGLHLVVSARGPAELIYRAELLDRPDATVVYTRSAPDDSSRPPGRLTADDLRPLLQPGATVFICGSARFADGATVRALEAGADERSIRVERFGPTT